MDTIPENNKNERPLRLLIVDDEDLLARTLQSFFKRKGHSVVSCGNAEEALARDDASQFDLLIADLQLPQMDGIELISRMQTVNPDLSAILMTGHASVESAVKALRGGAVDYMQKPFTLTSLDSVVDRASQMQQLKRANRELETQLRSRNRELEAVNQELDAFAARLAHDLRSPINNVRGLVAVVREELGANEDLDLNEIRDLLSRAVRSGDQALRMVNDLLDFARLGHGHLQLAPVNLNTLLKRCVEPLAAHLPAERCRIEIEPLPTVLGHEGLLSQVFLNLLDNAIKYTEPKPHMLIQVDAVPSSEGHTEIRLRDNGVGFDPQQSKLLFLPFQRLHRRSEFTGEGMGLANVKRIVERHGGTVEAQSRFGEGATFTVTLRVA
jgi:two-component system sensor histidine kinase/response regulator